MSMSSSKTLLALAVTAACSTPVLAQQQGQGGAGAAGACENLVALVQQAGPNAQGLPVTLEQARRYQSINDASACRQVLAAIAQRAHAQVGVDANVRPRDFGRAASAQQGGQMGQLGGQMGQMGGGQMGQQQGGQQGQQARVPEQYRQEQGRVVDVRPARVRGVGTPNYLVVLETQPGRRVVADIGQNAQTLNLQPGAPVMVRGQIVRVGNRGALLLADTVRIGNQTFDINRPAFVRPQRQPSGQTGLQRTGQGRLQERVALRQQLRQLGFQNIRILNAAYLVQARVPDGRTVLMVVDPPARMTGGATGGGRTGGQDQRSQTGQGGTGQQANAQPQAGSAGAGAGAGADAISLSEDQVRSILQARGLSNIENLSREGNFFTASADWQGQQVDVRVNATTGEILAPEQLI